MSDLKTRMNFLKVEVPMIAHFLSEFEFSVPTIKPSLNIEDNWEYIMIKNFPLSDEFRPDHENITIVTIDYPDFGPGGIHVPNNSPNLSHIKSVLGGHVFENERISQLGGEYGKHVEEIPGWTWVCYHYDGWKWNFNPNNIMCGDNLFKFIVALYANLSGEFYG
jgi:hypothetical protein